MYTMLRNLLFLIAHKLMVGGPKQYNIIIHYRHTLACHIYIYIYIYIYMYIYIYLNANKTCLGKGTCEHDHDIHVYIYIYIYMRTKHVWGKERVIISIHVFGLYIWHSCFWFIHMTFMFFGLYIWHSCFLVYTYSVSK